MVCGRRFSTKWLTRTIRGTRLATPSATRCASCATRRLRCCPRTRRGSWASSRRISGAVSAGSPRRTSAGSTTASPRPSACARGGGAAARVEGSLSEGATVRTLGPLIHNTQEIHRLEAEGVRTIDAPADVSAGETAVIRAHGVTPQVQRELEGRGRRGIDATRPFVTKVQKLAERAAAQGRDVVVVGNPDHPEMIGVVGYAPERTRVVRDASEVANL